MTFTTLFLFVCDRFSLKAMMAFDGQSGGAGGDEHRVKLIDLLCAEQGVTPRQSIPSFLRRQPSMFFKMCSDHASGTAAGSARGHAAPGPPPLLGSQPRSLFPSSRSADSLGSGGGQVVANTGLPPKLIKVCDNCIAIVFNYDRSFSFYNIINVEWVVMSGGNAKLREPIGNRQSTDPLRYRNA